MLIKSFWDELKIINTPLSAIKKDLCICKTIDLLLDGFICTPVSGFRVPCNLKRSICLFVKSCVNFAVNNKGSIVKKASMMANKLKSGKQLR